MLPAVNGPVFNHFCSAKGRLWPNPEMPAARRDGGLPGRTGRPPLLAGEAARDPKRPPGAWNYVGDNADSRIEAKSSYLICMNSASKWNPSPCLTKWPRPGQGRW